MTYYINSTSLYHHGVKGMKWGVRRYQNPDGSLTKEGKKRSKEYSKLHDKTAKNMRKAANRVYYDAYNKAAREMNEGGIDKFNAAQEKKYGKNYTRREGYYDDYNKLFSDRVSKIMNKMLSDIHDSDPNYVKAKKLVEEHGMDQWDDLVKEDIESIKDMHRASK